MRRRIGAAVLIGGAVLLLLGGWAFHCLRGSLAQLDGERVLPGLAAPATIERDREGVASIHAGNERDAARALGFVHAQERYFEMDLLRRSAAGELAALFGPVALERDREIRVHRLRSRMRDALDTLDREQGALLEAYTEGVQSGLVSLKNRPWPYLVLRQLPQPWRTEDSLLVAAAMAIDLQDENNRREYMFSRLAQHLPADMLAVLMSDGSDWDAPLWGDPRPVVDPPPAREPGQETPLPVFARSDNVEVSGFAVDGDNAVVGSNSLAVAAALTADGRALLANDMHLGLRAPSIWFRARLRYADERAAGGQVDVSGVSLPGLPGIVAGSNGRVAWGFTNSYGDWLDWVRVDWVDAQRSRYRTLQGEEAVRVHVERIAVAGAADELLRVRETRWGPVMHEQHADPRLSDAEAVPALSLLWTMHRPGAVDLGLLDLAHAGDLDAALAVGQRAGMPAQNLLVADHQGRIGWTIAGRLPQRLGQCDPQLPLTPLSGCDWAVDWLPPVQGPRLLDPPDGRLWTANSRVADGEALRLIGTGSYDLGARQRQIRDALRAAERFDERGLLAIQLDDRALFLQRWWQLLREIAEGSDDPALQRLEQATRQWEGQASVDAVSYRVVRAFRALVLTRIRDNLFAAARGAEGERWQEPQTTQIEGLAWSLLQQRPANWLVEPQLDWDSLLIDAATRTVVELELAGALQQRTWGERNTARICHPLAGALPGLLQPLLCRTADSLPGDANMPRVQGASFGASQRMVVAPGREADGILHAPAGQSGHPLSPFWDAGHRAWVSGEATPFLPGEPAYRLRLRP